MISKKLVFSTSLMFFLLTLMATKISINPEAVDCSICLEPLCFRTPCCKNLFHFECLKKWLSTRTRKTCPLCRKVFSDDVLREIGVVVVKLDTTNVHVLRSGNELLSLDIEAQQGFSAVKQYLQGNPGIVKLHLSLAKSIKQIPEDFFVGLTNLKDLYLSGNQLTNLPSTIWNLRGLKDLNLSGNQLANLPATIGDLRGLKYLDLSGNQLTNLPSTIGNLTNLQTLDLGGNQLTSLPSTIGNLTNLEFLLLLGNQLTNLPATIGNLIKLREVKLGNNRLTNLPESLPGGLRQRMQEKELRISGMDQQHPPQSMKRGQSIR